MNCFLIVIEGIWAPNLIIFEWLQSLHHTATFSFSNQNYFLLTLMSQLLWPTVSYGDNWP